MQPRLPERFALRELPAAHGNIAWREAGQGLPLVFLHGIGSGAASFGGQLAGLSDHYRVIAWDAPGYGRSSPLEAQRPLARDYARVLADFLARLKINELVLIGHSLGAIIAAAWAARPTARLHALVLASPARGYATAPPALREAKWRERIDAVGCLGVEGLAAQRAAGLCAPGGSAEAIGRVRENMERVTPGGYAQAAHLLAHDDLLTHLRQVTAPVHVLCGALDAITPPAACAEVAQTVGAPYLALSGVGHASYVEDADQFNHALRTCLASGQVTATQKATHD